MRARGTWLHGQGCARWARTTLATTTACLLLSALGFVGAAAASPAPVPTIAPYGQVAAVGGFDAGAMYDGGAVTTGLDSTSDEFVDPVGMAVRPDPGVPGGNAIYVLDNVNPQSLDTLLGVDEPGGLPNPDGLSLTYRIQEFAIAPSATPGDDTGTEIPLACTYFTLASTSTAPDQRAVSLAAGGQDVDVLVNDQPDENPVQAGADTPGDFSTAYEVDEWTAGLANPQDPGAPVTPDCASYPASLAAPDTVVQPSTLINGNSTLERDIDGDSIAFAGSGASAQLALGGTEYLSPADLNAASHQTTPIIESFGSDGAVSGTWNGAEMAANSIARAGSAGWGIDDRFNRDGDKGDALYAMSTNPDGTLNVTLGPQEYTADATTPSYEPIMATVSADLSTTTPVLPSADTAPLDGEKIVNDENAATDASEQDTADGNDLSAPSGGTQYGGTLAPSVVELETPNPTYPQGLYAGLVADESEFGTDANETSAGTAVAGTPAAPAWTIYPATGATANLGIRVFDGAGGNPLAMIGNAGSGACSVQSGDYGPGPQSGGALGNLPSTLALAAGANGTVYALTQPDLDGPGDTSINPGDPVSAVGDTVQEFVPGAGSGGAAGTACPQPSGTFSVTDTSIPDSAPLPTGTAADPIQVVAGSSLQFDASAVDLQGGVPWTYSWDSAQAGGTTRDLTQSSTFAPDVDNDVYERASPTFSNTYTTPGTYTVTLDLLSDFGPSAPITQTIDVTPPGGITAAFTAAGSAVAGQPTAFDASESAVAPGDDIVDYNWNFGYGATDDTAGPDETWIFPSAGTYAVTLTVIDVVGGTQTFSELVSVAPAPVSATPAAAAPTPTPAPAPTPTPRNRTATTVSPEVRSIRRSTALDVKVSCPTTKVSCGGAILVRTAKAVAVAGKRGRHVVTLGRAAFDLKGGTSKTVLIRLDKETAALIEKNMVLSLQLSVAAHDSYGDAKTTRVIFDLFPPRSHRPRQFG